MKTVEIMLVIVVTTIFMLVIIPNPSSNLIKERQPYLIHLEEVDEFRDFVSENNGCYDSEQSEKVDILIKRYLPKEYDYTFCINAKIDTSIYLSSYGTPAKDIYVDTLFFAGNYTHINVKIIRLYYWSKS